MSIVSCPLSVVRRPLPEVSRRYEVCRSGPEPSESYARNAGTNHLPLATDNGPGITDKSKSRFCQLYSLHQCPGLINRFLKLPLWNGISNNSTSGLNIDFS